MAPRGAFAKEESESYVVWLCKTPCNVPLRGALFVQSQRRAPSPPLRIRQAIPRTRADLACDRQHFRSEGVVTGARWRATRSADGARGGRKRSRSRSRDRKKSSGGDRKSGGGGGDSKDDGRVKIFSSEGLFLGCVLPLCLNLFGLASLVGPGSSPLQSCRISPQTVQTV
jgi:hypothetical protein